MYKFNIAIIVQIYNEEVSGNLQRFFKINRKFADNIIVYDSGSTDESFNIYSQFTSLYVRKGLNKFENEGNARRELVDLAFTTNPDFILWLDADETLIGTRELLEGHCIRVRENNFDAVAFREINLWRSLTWYRTDSNFNDGVFVRLWDSKKKLLFRKSKIGLHKQLFPHSIKKYYTAENLAVIHYGFHTIDSIIQKYLTYDSFGQIGYLMLDRFIDERSMCVAEIEKNLLDRKFSDDNTAKPISLDLDFYKKAIKQAYRKFTKPKFSIICLIYKSTEWLEFIVEEIYSSTDMRYSELIFIANNATEEVLNKLKYLRLKYFVLNSHENEDEWYINRVYRAYNYGASVSNGDYLIFINSDMAFSNHWLENLFKRFNGKNVVSARLIESGKFKTGKHGIIKNLGREISEFKSEKFKKYSNKISKDAESSSGLYMPILIKKNHFEKVGGYPEGNIKISSSIYSLDFAKKGERNISGDKALIIKLSNIGIHHITSFDSIVYHFQNGEIDSEYNLKENRNYIALCNDVCGSSIGNEKNFWDFLKEGIDSIDAIDNLKFKKNKNYRGYSRLATKYIKNNNFDIIIQNASFIKKISDKKFTISFLQDNLKKMNYKYSLQKKVLDSSQVIIANNQLLADEYKEYKIAVIPIGLDTELFKPLDKANLRQKHNFIKDQKIGIFVGSLNEVKGFDEIKGIINERQDIHWIIVSKYDEYFEAENVTFYNKIDQILLAELYNCSDFFILGSKIETHCLAALEACACNIPVLMRNVGYFATKSNIEKKIAGIFTDDLKSEIDNILKNEFSPRQFIELSDLSIQSMITKWENVIQDNLPKARNFNNKLGVLYSLKLIRKDYKRTENYKEIVVKLMKFLMESKNGIIFKKILLSPRLKKIHFLDRLISFYERRKADE